MAEHIRLLLSSRSLGVSLGWNAEISLYTLYRQSTQSSKVKEAVSGELMSLWNYDFWSLSIWKMWEFLAVQIVGWTP